MTKTDRKLVRKNLKCSICLNVQTIQRLYSRNKKNGHLKHLWCPICNKTTAHIELKEFELNS